MVGKRPDASQSKVPPSIIAPPIATPCPPRNLVTECMTISAPWSNGRNSQGVAKVLSIITGMPWRWAISEITGRSMTSRPGLPRVSPKTSRVSGRIAASKAAGSRGSTKVVDMPKRGSVWVNRLWVPP